ncbi:hypothetical protein LTR53_011129 [Teratosphaeriaceae sp. CCFEE 6253]|nr:hypothetical protein LTR53_011129 [Teratosphaeriaceae sp. CCFEE 6253]
MNANAVGDILSNRAVWAGFSAGVSFYSWRAKALTNATEASGRRIAKMVAAHQADGIELEEYYDQGLYSWDAVGVMLEGNEDPDAEELPAQMESETIYRTPLARHSAVRSAPVDAYVLAHPSYVSAVSSGIHSAVYATRKRLRYSASLALLEHERALQREDLDVDEVQSRREALQKPSSLCELIQQHMASRDSGLSPANHEDEDINDLFSEQGDAPEAGMRDMKEQVGLEDGEGNERELLADGGDDHVDEESEDVREATVSDDLLPDVSSDYSGAAAASKELMLEFKASQGKLCSKCHEAPSSHAKCLPPPDQQMGARIAAAEKLRRNKQIACPYGCGARFATVKARIAHLKEPMNPENDGEEHDDLKAKDGWYSAGFFGVIAPKKGKKQKAMVDEEGTDDEVVHDTTIKQFEGRAPGRWAGLPEVSGLVEFDAAAAADTTGSLTYFGVNG